jgi:hypothetical protein
MLSAQLVRSDENCPSTDRPMPTTAIFNPTRPRHIKHCPYRKLDPFVRCDQSRRSRLSIRRPAEQSGGQRPVGCVPATTFMRLRVPWPDAGEVVIAGHRRVRFATLNPSYAPALEAEHVMLSPPSISCVNGPRRKIG